MKRLLLAFGPVAAALWFCADAGVAQAQGWPQNRAKPAAAGTPCVLDRCVGGAAPAAPGPAQPQAETPDENIIPPPPRRRYGGSRDESGGSAPGNFDFYVLSLSWSSGFCETGGDGNGNSQCDAGSGLGFVVHGLWPQFERGFPSNCGGGGEPSRIALNEAKGLFPDEGLARYEWRKHGACSGKNPQAYFADARRAYEALTIPDDYKHPTDERTAAPLDVARAFISANRGLRLDAMAVACKSQTLQEVRICFAKDLRSFRDCPEVARGACRTRGMRIPPVR